MGGQKKLPRTSLVLLGIFFFASFFAGVLAPYGADQMDSAAVSLAPGGAHPFGTDTMGRDLLSMVLYGGRLSLVIGVISTVISTVIAVIYGTVSGVAGKWTDNILMRFTDLVLSVPALLLMLFLQAMWGPASWLSLSVIIGAVSWPQMAKLVRSEVRQIRKQDYILAAQLMEGGFWYILRRHLLPTFLPSLMFMTITNLRQAIITESTLSFLGLGLPLAAVSWGSLLSMSQEALLTGCWWMIVIPGAVLIATLVCVTEVGEALRRGNERWYSNL